MKPWLRSIRRDLTGSPDERATLLTFRRQGCAVSNAATLVRVFYVAMFFILLQQYPSWSGWLRLVTSLHPLWPVWWIPRVGVTTGIAIVLFGSLLCCLCAAILPERRACRILAAGGMLEFAAFFNSFGAVGNGLHASVWVAAIFILLPDGAPDSLASSRRRAQRYLRVFWAAQAAVLLFYTMSGSFKVAGIFLQMSRGQVHALMPEALSRHIAQRLLESMPAGPQFIGPFFIDHPYAGWPMQLSALYLETFAFVVAFRPALHRVWGLGLIMMHLGIYFTMSIMFSWQCLLLGLLLVCSPLAPPRLRLAEAVRALPVFGDALRWSRKLRLRALRPRVPLDVDDEPEFTPLQMP
jgi:hypothetical protein